MNVVVVSHYFPPEIGAPQARLSEMARVWAETDDVTVLTGMPNHPTGVIPPAYQGKRSMTEDVDGYRVVRTWLYATPNEGIVKKTLGHLSFMLSGPLLGFRKIGKPDVIMVSSPTFFSIVSAWLLAKVKRAAFVIDVRDLWPAIFVDLGVLKNRQVIWLLERLELAMYAAADHVVVVTEGFRDDLLRRGVPARKVSTITNGVDLERFAKAPRSPTDRAWLGASADDCLVLYLGAHGISQGLVAIADAAAACPPGAHFAFVGEGAAKRDLERRVAELGLENVTMHAGVPRDRVLALLGAADLCLVPLRDIELFDTFIPSKMFEYMAAGTPILGSVRGESAAILRAAGAAVVAPEDASAIAERVMALAADPKRRDAMAVAGRTFVEANYDRRVLATEYRSILVEAAA